MRFALAAALVCAAALAAERPPVEEAWDLVAKGNRPEAVRLLRKIIQSNPRDADARLLLGSLLQEAGQRDECLEQLHAAVQLRPNSAEAQNALGEAYTTFGESQKARGPFERAVALDPRLAAARVNLGLLLLEAGDAKAAVIHLDRAIALLGHSQDAAYPLYLRAKIYSEHEQTDKAAAALAEAVSLRPDFGEAWSDLGNARKTLGDDAGAIAAFRRAVEINPEDAVAQTRLGAAYLAQGKAHLAVPCFQAAVRLAPSDQSALNGLQRALREDGQEQQADEVKKKLTELLRAKDKADQNALAAIRINNQGADLEKSGHLRAALEKYRAAHELDPNHVGIQVNYAVAMLRLGQWKDGLALLRDAARRQPGDAVLKAALEDALTQAPVEFGGKGQTRSPGARGGARY
ncbi:MAG TPA: tetratricopeptide repeat protein [Bryobacteraceae bacterium]|nr:tetratricopeptide repeat protein [Bryobacteraceae bacterium]